MGQTKEIISIVIANAVVGLLCILLPISFGILLLILVLIGWLVFAVVNFGQGFIISLFYALLSALFVYVLVIIYKYLIESRQRKFIKSAFSRYVSRDLVEQITKDPDVLKLGGERRELSILFADLQGFTSLSEKLKAEEVVNILNDYLDDMTNMIFDHQGTLDKYIGDAVMAFWNAPLRDEKHAYHACLTAIEMSKRMREINIRYRKEMDIDLQMRIGVNTGEAVVGNIGAKARFDYTVIGDNVNLASRLEGVNKTYGTYTIISEKTYKRVKDKFEVRELDDIKVKGKQEPIKIFHLVDKKGALEVQGQTIINLFKKGRDLYLRQEWEKAKEVFQEILEIDAEDGPSKTYIERCDYFMKRSPGEGWDGVFEMKTK